MDLSRNLKMEFFMLNLFNKTHSSSKFSAHKTIGFTLIELMASISILGILTGIAIPNFSTFIIKMRVDNEISQLYRLLFISRNLAINSRQTVTLCHLDNALKCDSNWDKELSVFIDTNANKKLDTALNEKVIQIKAPIKLSDKLHYGIGRNGVIYAPTGRLAGWGSNGTFRYCPNHHPENNRGIRVATSGRLYVSSDIDNDDKDEDRNGKELKCR